MNLRTDLLVVDFSCRFIRGAGSPTMLKSYSFSAAYTPISHNSPPAATSFFTPTSSSTDTAPRLAPPPHFPLHFHPHSFAHKIKTVPPQSARVPLPPRAAPCLARSSQTGSTTLGPLHPPSSLRAPPARPCPPPPSSIHHICPPASITSPQRQRTQRKEKAKARREEYSRYHAEQCRPEYRLLSRALPLLAWSLLQTHPLLRGNNSPEAWGMEPGCVAI